MNWKAFGIDISKVRGGKTFCPRCHDLRKHQHDRSLSVDLTTGLFNCHNAGCGFKGMALERKKEYPPLPPRLEKVGESVVNYFAGRGISNNTLLRFGITESSEWMPQLEKEVKVICFNYFRKEELVNIKFRGPQKSFKLVSGAELIFYHLDSISGSKEVVIVEGEIDAMSMYEAGIHHVVSVPNGASLGSMRLEYLDNCWDSFEDKEKIIVAVDNDDAGRSLREELARRLGKDRCYQVDFRECKDANEVLTKLGKETLKSIVDNAIAWPLEGIITMDDMFPIIEDYFMNGYPKGADTGISNFDNLLSFAEGQLTVVTGIPGSGKDEFVNFIMARLSERHDWPFAICGFEEPPEFHVTKMLEKYTGKAFMFRANPEHRMTEEEKNYGIFKVDKYMHYINIDQVGATMDAILIKARELVKKKGIKGLVVNPWNCLEHSRPSSMSETEYVGKVLDQITSFCRATGVHTFLIAHPTKVKKTDGKKYDVPTLYSISGSAHFFNKTHNGMVVYRDFETNQVEIYVQKVKWPWLGRLGSASFHFDINTRQYKI